MKVKLLYINMSVVKDFLSEQYESKPFPVQPNKDMFVVLEKGLPNDAKVINAHFNHDTDQLILEVQSETFGEVNPELTWLEYPSIDVMFKVMSKEEPNIRIDMRNINI